MDDDIKMVEDTKLSDTEEAIVNSQWEIADRLNYGENYDIKNWGFRSLYFKATWKGEFAGVIHLELEGGVGFIDELLVFESYRDKGIGTALLEKAEAFCRQENCHKMTLETHQKLSAYDLYVRNGFTIEAELKHSYGDQDSIVMSKMLV